MFPRTMLPLVVAALLAVGDAHTVMTYPGWRGNTLIQNESWPYGMQWIYPCGGLPLTQNRTYWPVSGGAVAWQPGWFQGHATAFQYINLGLGTSAPDGGPLNMSFPMVPVFQIVGPNAHPYPGSVCLPQVPLPVNITVSPGDNATIQVVEIAVHGAALFSCVDITFVEDDSPLLAPVNETNCFNSTDMGFNDVFTIQNVIPPDVAAQTSGAVARGLELASLGVVLSGMLAMLSL